MYSWSSAFLEQLRAHICRGVLYFMSIYFLRIVCNFRVALYFGSTQRVVLCFGSTICVTSYFRSTKRAATIYLLRIVCAVYFGSTQRLVFYFGSTQSVFLYFGYARCKAINHSWFSKFTWVWNVWSLSSLWFYLVSFNIS